MLARDPTSLTPPAGDVDETGWALPGTEVGWSGTANLQLNPGLSAPTATSLGGHGPYDPARVEEGVLYLPPQAARAAVDGAVAEVRGRRFYLSQVRESRDPLTDNLDCLVASVTRLEVATWRAVP